MSGEHEAHSHVPLVGESAAMVEVRQLVEQVSRSAISVLITGPSGSGKEVVARSIHVLSGRAGGRYVAVNCGAIPRDLLESELFGHEKGAFTGAVSQRQGRFEEAHGGTLFLDEIGDMPADMQVKLLRVLEERRVQRIGARGDMEVDARVISATHRDLERAIDGGRFREDLFYRLAVFPIHLPPLAERREDIPLLVRAFLRRKTDVRFDPSAMRWLSMHDWPGNVRELRNVIERASVLYPCRTIGLAEVETLLLPRRRSAADNPPIAAATAEEKVVPLRPRADQPAETAFERPLIGDRPVDLRSIVAELEQAYIEEALAKANGVVAEAARSLSLQRTTLIEKMRKLGLSKAA
jgi:sigma-54 specific flagellar transcriptional regulator A